MYRAYFIIFYNNQKMHKYSTNYVTPICFDTMVSSPDSLKSILCQITQVFQMQLLVIQFIVQMFHIGFMHKALFTSSLRITRTVRKIEE